MDSKYKDILSDQTILSALLKDHSTSTEDINRNIFWATNDYEQRGNDFRYSDEILPLSVSGDNYNLILPRILKNKSEQSARAKDMAEVFTPSWLCNKMNNAADEQWFGRSEVFNKEIEDNSSLNAWVATSGKIRFPKEKDWKEYIKNTKLEITCGEAPFLVSRYDTTTGEEIPLSQRIGILDRKLRVVNEHTKTENGWHKWATKAYKSIYGYEWQGDSLWITRKALLITYLEYFEDKFGKLPDEESVLKIADIISWNLWQMDGLKCVVPDSCHEIPAEKTGDIFAETQQIEMMPCPGCHRGEPRLHNGIKCRIMDWESRKPILFIDTIKR